MIQLHSATLESFFKKNKIDIDVLSKDKTHFFTLEDYNSNVINITVERNIILFGKYQFISGLIEPVLEFCMYRQGALLVPVALNTPLFEVRSAIYSDKLKIMSPRRHSEILNTLETYLIEFNNFEFKITDNAILESNTNIM